MAFVYFDCIDPEGEFSHRSYGGPDIESCFVALNGLVDRGWQLTSVRLIESPDKRIDLPVDIFDGMLIQTHFDQLERTYTTLLKFHEYFAAFFIKNRQTTAVVEQAIQKTEQIHLTNEGTRKRIVALFAKMDRIQAGIQQTKDEWGVR